MSAAAGTSKTDPTKWVTLSNSGVNHPNVSQRGRKKNTRKEQLITLFQKVFQDKECVVKNPLTKWEALAHFKVGREHTVNLFLQTQAHASLMAKFDEVFYRASPVRNLSEYPGINLSRLFWNRVTSPGGYKLFHLYENCFNKLFKECFETIALKWRRNMRFCWVDTDKKIEQFLDFTLSLSSLFESSVDRIAQYFANDSSSNDARLLLSYLSLQAVVQVPSLMKYFLHREMEIVVETHDYIQRRSLALIALEAKCTALTEECSMIVAEGGEKMHHMLQGRMNALHSLSQEKKKFHGVLPCDMGDAAVLRRLIPQITPFDRAIINTYISSSILDLEERYINPVTIKASSFPRLLSRSIMLKLRRIERQCLPMRPPSKNTTDSKLDS